MLCNSGNLLLVQWPAPVHGFHGCDSVFAQAAFQTSDVGHCSEELIPPLSLIARVHTFSFLPLDLCPESCPLKFLALSGLPAGVEDEPA